MVLALAFFALTCLISADVVQQEPKTVLSSSEVTTLNKKVKKWFKSHVARENAEGRKRQKLGRALTKSRAAFRKEWDKLSAKKGDLLASVVDLRAVFQNGFFYDRVSGLSGTMKQVKDGGVNYYHRVPKSYKPDMPIRTVLVLPGFRKDRWLSPKDYFEVTWKGASVLEDTALLFPTIDNDLDLDPIPNMEQGGGAVELQRIGAVLMPCGSFQKTFNMNREEFYLDCGRGASGFGLRLAANFPDRFAGLILRSPINEESIRVGSLTGLPILLISDSDTKEDCAALAERINALKGGRCMVIEGEGDYPFLGSQTQIGEWLVSDENSTRRNLFRERVVIEPIMDQFKKGYWVEIGTAEPLSSVALEDRPYIEAVADRKANRITVTARSIAGFTLNLNDEILDLSKEYTVVVNGTAFTEQRDRSFRQMTEKMLDKFDPSWIFTAKHTASIPKQ